MKIRKSGQKLHHLILLNIKKKFSTGDKEVEGSEIEDVEVVGRVDEDDLVSLPTNNRENVSSTVISFPN